MGDIEQEFGRAWEEKTGEPLPGLAPRSPAPEPEAEAEEPQEPTEVVEQPEQPLEVEPEQRKWGGLYDTPEELEQDYRQRIGSMTQEIGQLRQQQQELDQLRQYVQSQQQQQPYQPPINVDDDPRTATYEAVRRGDFETYNRALAAWADEEPGAALLFSQQVNQAQNNQMIAQALYQREQVQNTTRVAWDASRQRLPEFDSMVEPMVEAAKKIPNFEAIVQQGSQEQKEQAFETAYWMARGMQGMTGPQQAAPAAPAPHPLAERTAAYVAPATNGAAPQGERRSGKEQEADAFRAAFDRGLELMSE